MNPPGGYQDGMIYVFFLEVNDGTIIYLSSDESSFPPVSITTGSFKIYKVPFDQSIRISVVSTESNASPKFAFKYWNDGKKIEDAEIHEKIKTAALPKKEPDAVDDHSAIIITIGGSIIAFFIFIGMCCCVFKFVREKALRNKHV
jgi:hypothetical protein